MYINTVNINTKYDNTAFIVGLSAILTQTSFEPIKELKKINKNLQTHGSYLDMEEGTIIREIGNIGQWDNINAEEEEGG